MSTPLLFGVTDQAVHIDQPLLSWAAQLLCGLSDALSADAGSVDVSEVAEALSGSATGAAVVRVGDGLTGSLQELADWTGEAGGAVGAVANGYQGADDEAARGFGATPDRPVL